MLPANANTERQEPVASDDSPGELLRQYYPESKVHGARHVDRRIDVEFGVPALRIAPRSRSSAHGTSPFDQAPPSLPALSPCLYGRRTTTTRSLKDATNREGCHAPLGLDVCPY